jgi:hypothetical protein
VVIKLLNPLESPSWPAALRGIFRSGAGSRWYEGTLSLVTVVFVDIAVIHKYDSLLGCSGLVVV